MTLAPALAGDTARLAPLPWRAITRYAVAGTLLAVVAVLVGVLRSDQGILALLVPGEDGPAAPLIRHDFPGRPLLPELGHDGQQFYAVARELPHLDEAAPSLDRPRYRTQRILLPALARLAYPSGTGVGLVVALFAVGAVGLLLGALATGVVATHYGGPAWLAAGFPVLPGALAALSMTVADAFGLALALAALAAYLRRALPLAVVLGVLAVLAKEWALLTLVAVVPWERCRRALVFAGIPALACGLWWLWVRVTLPATDKEIRELDPVRGLLDAVGRWLDGYSLPAALYVLGAAVLGALVLVRSGLRTPLGWAVVIQLAAIPLLAERVLANQWNASRATLGVYVCALPLLVGPRLREQPVEAVEGIEPDGDARD